MPSVKIPTCLLSDAKNWARHWKTNQSRAAKLF